MRALLAIALVIAPALALADHPGTAALKQARLHYDRGMAKYQLGEFDAAVDEFKLAFAASPAPGLLFNLAQASRLGKHPEQALHFYRSYLRMLPNAANRGDVEARILELEPQVRALLRDRDAPAPLRESLPAETREAPAAAPPEPPASPPLAAPAPATPAGAVDAQVAASPPARVARSRTALRIAGVTVGGVGLVGLGLGIYFGVTAAQAQSQLSAQTGNWSSASQDLYNSGQRDATVATALYAVGGVALAGGVALCVLGWHKTLLK
jgi:hypothetical protein